MLSFFFVQSGHVNLLKQNVLLDGSQSIKDTEGTVIITVTPHSSSRNTPISHNRVS